MARKEKKKTPKQQPPWQFRPGPELEQLVTWFAAENRLQLNEACKVLVALAVTDFDMRYYGLMSQLAVAIGGTNSFVRACIYVHTALEGARRATGRPMRREVERLPFILATIQDFLASKGLLLQTQGIWFIDDLNLQEVETEWPAVEEQPQQQRTRT